MMGGKGRVDDARCREREVCRLFMIIVPCSFLRSLQQGVGCQNSYPPSPSHIHNSQQPQRVIVILIDLEGQAGTLAGKRYREEKMENLVVVHVCFSSEGGQEKPTGLIPVHIWNYLAWSRRFSRAILGCSMRLLLLSFSHDGKCRLRNERKHTSDVPVINIRHCSNESCLCINFLQSPWRSKLFFCAVF